MNRCIASNKIEVKIPRWCWIVEKESTLNENTLPDSLLQVEVLQEEVTYATEEVERLTKVLDEQSNLLQASQEKAAQKDIVIQNLKQKVKLLS